MMIQYLDDKPCECCRYEKAKTREFQVHKTGLGIFDKVPMQLCEICSNTFISQSVQYIDQYNNQYIAQSIAWIGNEIIRILKEERK